MDSLTNYALDDPPDVALCKQAHNRGLREPKAWREGGRWIVSGFKGGELRLYCPADDGWEELTVEGAA